MDKLSLVDLFGVSAMAIVVLDLFVYGFFENRFVGKLKEPGRFGIKRVGFFSVRTIKFYKFLVSGNDLLDNELEKERRLTRALFLGWFVPVLIGFGLSVLSILLLTTMRVLF